MIKGRDTFFSNAKGFSGLPNNMMFIQRKVGCACDGSCPSCKEKEKTLIQPKLKINHPNDKYEQPLEASKDYAEWYLVQHLLQRIDERAMDAAGRQRSKYYTDSLADRQEFEGLLAISLVLQTIINHTQLLNIEQDLFIKIFSICFT